MSKKKEIWFEMGPYGSVGAHIKTGRSPMAPDHFQTPPDPQKGYTNQEMTPTNLKTGWGHAGDFSPTRLACGVLTVKKGYRLG